MNKPPNRSHSRRKAMVCLMTHDTEPTEPVSNLKSGMATSPPDQGSVQNPELEEALVQDSREQSRSCQDPETLLQLCFCFLAASKAALPQHASPGEHRACSADPEGLHSGCGITNPTWTRAVCHRALCCLLHRV